MPSLKPERTGEEFFAWPNGDVGFTFTVIARKSGVEANGGLIDCLRPRPSKGDARGTCPS